VQLIQLSAVSGSVKMAAIGGGMNPSGVGGSGVGVGGPGLGPGMYAGAMSVVAASPTSSGVVFMIVGKSEPLYQADIGLGADEHAYLHQFILHSSLDMIQSAMWVNPSTFLRVVDRFNDLQISAYLTPGGATLLLLHKGKNEDAVRAFFTDAHDLYVKVRAHYVTLNPNLN
jgi:hypothetical protein